MLAVIANLLCVVLFAGLLQLAYLVDKQLFILSALVGLGFILTLAKLDKIEAALSETRRQQVMGVFGKLVFFLLACAFVIGSSWVMQYLHATGRLDRWSGQEASTSQSRRNSSRSQRTDAGNEKAKDKMNEDSSSTECAKAEKNNVGEGRVELVEVIENKEGQTK
jgi:hypothetical protein